MMTGKQKLAGLTEAKRVAWGQLFGAVGDMDKLASTVSSLRSMTGAAYDDPMKALTLALAGIARRAHDAMRVYTDTEDQIEDTEYNLGQKLAREAVKRDRAAQKQKPQLAAGKIARRSRKAVAK